MRFFGHCFTPMGPRLLDKITEKALHLSGDFVTDYRLIDYLVALASTAQCPALDGRIGNADRLKEELTNLGVFDRRMSFYQFYKLREFSALGFSGFEGRYYSLFDNLEIDMASAVDMQVLITALASHYALSGEIGHSDIPDSCFIESERRQIIFGSAIGIPHVYFRKHTKNTLLKRILRFVDNTRSSSKYHGYVKVGLPEFRIALLRLVRIDARPLIEQMGTRSYSQRS